MLGWCRGRTGRGERAGAGDDRQDGPRPLAHRLLSGQPQCHAPQPDQQGLLPAAAGGGQAADGSPLCGRPQAAADRLGGGDHGEALRPGLPAGARHDRRRSVGSGRPSVSSGAQRGGEPERARRGRSPSAEPGAPACPPAPRVWSRRRFTRRAVGSRRAPPRSRAANGRARRAGPLDGGGWRLGWPGRVKRSLLRGLDNRIPYLLRTSGGIPGYAREQRWAPRATK